MPEIAQEHLAELIKNPDRYGASDVVAALHYGDRLPENHQVGPTCGIYSLDGALKLRGGWYAPPARNLGNRDKLSRLVNPSAVRIAKMYHLSQIGEIGSCEDIQFLAATMGYARAEIKQIDSPDGLWAVITECAKARRGIVMPYVCRDGGEATDNAKDAFAHWCLVFGRYRTGFLRNVLAVTYGKYFRWDVGRLQRSNAAIRDWESQIWVRYPMWWSDPGAPDEAASWERSAGARNNEWCKHADAGSSLDMVAEMLAQAGFGFGLGFSKDRQGPALVCVRARTWAPPHRLAYRKPSTYLNHIDSLPGVKKEPLRAVEYSKTMAHRCVAV